MGKKMYLKDAAKELGIASHYLRQMAREGKCPVLMAGNRYLFDLELMEEYLKKEAMKNIKELKLTKGTGVLRKVEG